MQKLLIIRFSALGDVAMTVPVVYSLAKQYPDVDITMLSTAKCRTLFEQMPENVHFFAADLHGRHHGIAGLNTLLSEMNFKSFDFIADFHDVLRTKYLRMRFVLANKKVARIHKGRWQKKQLTRRHHKVLKQLSTSFRRYNSVLEKLGFHVDLNFSGLDFQKVLPQEFSKEKNEKWIGIAPFAKHIGKIYPLDKMEQVAASLSKNNSVKIFLFGGGKNEKALFENWCRKNPQMTNVANRFRFDEELGIMQQMDVMVSMDSANMHFASLLEVPVVSIWGATHPYAGFVGWNQPAGNAVQTDLSCRPCSVFGEKNCFRGDYACMNRILPELIVEKVKDLL